MDIRRNMEIIEDSYHIMMSTKNVDTFLSRYELFRNIVNDLINYSKQGFYIDAEAVNRLDEIEKAAHDRVADFVHRVDREIKDGVEVITEYAENDRMIRQQEVPCNPTEII